MRQVNRTYRTGSGSCSGSWVLGYPVGGKGDPVPVMVPPGATRFMEFLVSTALTRTGRGGGLDIRFVPRFVSGFP